jgi:hypothetical protein
VSLSLTKRLKVQLPRRGGRATWAQAVRLAISEGQPDTAYELAAWEALVAHAKAPRAVKTFGPEVLERLRAQSAAMGITKGSR